MACHADKIYVILAARGRVAVVDTGSGVVVEEWTIPEAGWLRGIVVHGGHIFVADYTHDCIRVLDMEGKQERQFGTRGSRKGQFQSPDGMAISHDLLYVCDYGNHRVQVFTLDGTWVRAWGTFKYPCGIAIHRNEVFVVNYGDHSVQKFCVGGKFLRMWGSQGTGDGEFQRPCDITINDNLVYVTDMNGNRVQVFKSWNGEFVGCRDIKGSAYGEFERPFGLCVDDNDCLWVGDHSNGRIQSFSVTGSAVDGYNRRKIEFQRPR